MGDVVRVAFNPAQVVGASVEAVATALWGAPVPGAADCKVSVAPVAVGFEQKLACVVWNGNGLAACGFDDCEALTRLLGLVTDALEHRMRDDAATVAKARELCAATGAAT